MSDDAMNRITRFPGIPLDQSGEKWAVYLDAIEAGKPRQKALAEAGLSKNASAMRAARDPQFAAEEARRHAAGVESRLRRRVDSVEMVELLGRKLVGRAIQKGEQGGWDAVARDEDEQRALALGKSCIIDAVKQGCAMEPTVAPHSWSTAGPMPPAASVREFVERDLGPDALPLSKLWPRIQWIVERAEDPDVRTVLLEVGKGSGKSTAAALIGMRVLQRLLARESPQADLDLAPGVRIGVLNVSVTGNQAQMAIFGEMAGMIGKSPWFAARAKPEETAGRLAFPRNVFAFSGSSNSAGAEGLTWICALADELDRLPEDATAGTSQARDLVEPVEGTLLTRFPRDGKLVLMSWPERRDSYIQQRVAAARKSGVARDLTADLRAVPIFRDDPGREAERRAVMADEPFREYPEEAFVSADGTLVVRGPTWAFSPRVDMAILAREAREKAYQFARMYGAKPLRIGENPFFRDATEFRRRAAPASRHPFDDDGRWKPDVKGDPATYYYAHVDVGLRRDAAGIAVGHYMDGVCVYDLLLEVRPQDQGDGRIRMKSLFDVLAEMAKRGFTFALVTVDGFQGLAGQESLEDMGFESEIFSVDKDRAAYDTFLEQWHAGRLDYYESEPLFACVESLVDLGRKIDHVASGRKDLSDAAAAVAHHVFDSVVGGS